MHVSKLSLNHLIFWVVVATWTTASAQHVDSEMRFRAQVDSVLRSSKLKLSDSEREVEVDKMVAYWKESIARNNLEQAERLARPFLIYPNHDTDLDQADLTRENGEVDVQALQIERSALEAIANNQSTDWRQLTERCGRFIADAKGRINAFTNAQYAHASLLYVLLRTAPNAETNATVLKSAKFLSDAGYLDPLLRWRAFERLSSSRHESEVYFSAERGRIERLINRNLGDTKRKITEMNAKQNQGDNPWLHEVQRLRDYTIQANEAINRANRIAKR
jgi:hypothetical protein